MVNVLDNESLYDAVVLGGLTSPGKVVLSGHDRKAVWDVRWGPFLNGAFMALKGIPPVEFTATFYLLRDASQGIDDFKTWPAFLAKINSTIVGRTPKATPIYHPDLASNDIKSVVKAQVGGATYDGKGGMTIAVKFQEYRPPRLSGGLPKSTPEVDPNAAAKAEVARLTAQYQKTPFG
jgi:hypothetical protein